VTSAIYCTSYNYTVSKSDRHTVHFQQTKRRLLAKVSRVNKLFLNLQNTLSYPQRSPPSLLLAPPIDLDAIHNDHIQLSRSYRRIIHTYTLTESRLQEFGLSYKERTSSCPGDKFLSSRRCRPALSDAFSTSTCSQVWR
jgi:hypothetical protein